MNGYAKGFSLIELMIVVAIIGILAVIVSNVSGDSAQKTRRAAVKTVMLEIQGKQERHHLNNREYASLATLGYASPLNLNADGNPVPQGQAFYRVTVATPNDFAFTITATPINGQANDSCGVLTLDQAGSKTAATTGCW